MNFVFKGRALKVGDNIDTDVIIPARYLVTFDPKELGEHCLEGISPEFPRRIEKGNILVAGENFGCGSSREHAPLAIKGAGISCVVAKSFARIFFRNSINVALPILEAPEAVEEIKQGDEVEVNLEEGLVRNLSTGKTYRTKPFPPFVKEIMEAGGLINFVKRRIGD